MDVKNMNKERMSFFIMLNENPTEWVGTDRSPLMSVIEGDIWDELQGLFPSRGPSHHPCVRYEDVMGHLFMQVVGLMNNAKYTKDTIKAARQYANQLMKKVCWNCRFSRVFRYGKFTEDLSAPGLSMKSSKMFANDTRCAETHNNCQSCRVSRLIILGNSFEELLYARTVSKTRNRHWHRLTTEINRRTKWRRRAKKAEFTLKKVIAAKRFLVSSNRAQNEDRVRMQKEIDKLRGFKDVTYVPPIPAPDTPYNRACKVVYDEFSKLSDKQLDELSKTDYIRNAIAAQKGMFSIKKGSMPDVDKEGLSFSIGSVKNKDVEPGDMPRVPEDLPDAPTANDIKKIHKTIAKIPEGVHPLEALLEEEEEWEDPPRLPVEDAVLSHVESIKKADTVDELVKAGNDAVGFLKDLEEEE